MCDHVRAQQTRNIFLGGSRTKEESFLLDQKFASVLDPKNPLIYIQTAMEQYSPEDCFQWVKSIFKPFGVTKIEMVTDLSSLTREQLFESNGIYIGGGNTTKLLQKIRESKIDKMLIQEILGGKPVYGVSAGALVLGLDIRSSYEVTEKSFEKTRGLNMLDGYSAIPHFSPEKPLPKIQPPFLAIPESSGVHIFGDQYNAVGLEAAYIIKSNKITKLDFGK